MAKLISHIFGRSYEPPKVQTHIDPGEGHPKGCRCQLYHN